MKQKSQAFLTSIFRDIITLFSPKQQRVMGSVMGGIMFNSILDVLGLAAILPVISVATDPSLVERNEYLNALYTYMEFQNTSDFLLFMVLTLLITFVIKNGVSLAILNYQAKKSFEIALDLARQMFLLYFSKGFVHVKDIDPGKFIVDIKNIPIFFTKQLLLPLMMLISEVIVVLIIITGIALVDWKLLILLAIILGSGFVLVYASTRKTLSRLGSERKVLTPFITSRLNENLSGYVDIVMHQKIPFFLRSFLHNQKRDYAIAKKIFFINSIPPKLNETIAVLGICLVFLYAILIASESREQLFFLLSMIAAAAYRVMPSMNRILVALMNIRSSRYTLDILSVLSESPGLNLEDASKEEVPFSREITLKNLGFHFEDAPEAPLLQDLDITIKKGETIGFIGESGSGKTTLMRIILRLFSQTKGELEVDGIPITAQNQSGWQHQIGYVQQDVFIIEGSIRENIAFGQATEDINEERILRIVNEVGLSSLISRLPEGIDTPIGESGSKLSGGQKQRLAIARALYHHAEVFAFDEVTSALDTETEQAIVEAIEALSQQGKTILLIAHRLTTLRFCDKIYELADGKVVGTYDYPTLMQQKAKFFQSTNA